jgi:hypothetical protein
MKKQIILEYITKNDDNTDKPYKVYKIIFDEILNEIEMKKRKVEGFNSVGDILHSGKYVKRGGINYEQKTT